MSASTFDNRNGATLGFRVLGESRSGEPPLVCHPGGPGMSAGYFGDLCGLAESGVQVVLLDPRGTGASGSPAEGSYELEGYVADLEDLRGQLGVEQLDLLGHSHGGFVSMMYALRHPERLRRLVLACTSPCFDPEIAREAEAAFAAHAGAEWFDDAIDAQRSRQERQYETREELISLYAREARLWFSVEGPGHDRFMETFVAERPDFRALHYFNDRIAPGFDIRSRLPEIVAPTLVINAEHDFFGPQASARQLAAIPGARIVIIPKAGHFVFAEAPDVFRAELEAHLV